jgi:DNA-binding transcriptional ArsR family regulator
MDEVLALCSVKPSPRLTFPRLPNLLKIVERLGPEGSQVRLGVETLRVLEMIGVVKRVSKNCGVVTKCGCLIRDLALRDRGEAARILLLLLARCFRPVRATLRLIDEHLPGVLPSEERLQICIWASTLRMKLADFELGSTKSTFTAVLKLLRDLGIVRSVKDYSGNFILELTRDTAETIREIVKRVSDLDRVEVVLKEDVFSKICKIVYSEATRRCTVVDDYKIAHIDIGMLNMKVVKYVGFPLLPKEWDRVAKAMAARGLISNAYVLYTIRRHEKRGYLRWRLDSIELVIHL